MAKEAGDKKAGAVKVKRPQALKRDLQSKRRKLVNSSFKSEVRTVIRSFEEALPKGDAAVIKEKLKAVYSIMDKGVKRGVFKLNKASRTKARMAARLAAVKA